MSRDARPPDPPARAAPAASWGMQATGRRRVARVYTNETCNQNCGFCDRRAPRERPRFVAPDAVRARIDAAGARAIVLTGGEPTLRRDLEALIAHAKQTATRVELETNATLIDDARARALFTAGLDVARVHLVAWGDPADAITRDPGGFAAALAGARALAAAGVALEAATPIVRANAPHVAGLPAALAESGLPIEALVLGVPTEGPADLLVPLDEAARVIEEVEAHARRNALPIRLDPHASLAPCLFTSPARLAHLFALTPGGAARAGHARLAACAGCAVRDRCPGVPAAQAPRLEGAARPIEREHVRRRLSLVSTVEEQIERELYQDELHRRPGAPPRRTRTVRVNFNCNQTCRFCFVSTHLPAAPDADVEAAIVEAARAGADVALSGGEPTLHPRLVELVRLAKREGARLVELQTNATRLDDDARVAALCDAGLDLAHVSLHASSAARSDAITGAPGTFERTVRGLDALYRARVRVRLSFVFCRDNLDDFPAYVDAVAARWPDAEIAASFVAPSTDLVPRDPALIPRYTEVVGHLGEGLRRARARGVRVSGLDSMCGVPLCLVPDELASYFALAEAPEGYDGGEIVDAEACRACALRGRCFGLRRGYAELHGTDELAPIRPPA
ncbi:MAG: radical SAM protein [Sandaracinaceae bacterium]|nr:radical SAM protein [Sandaracinaceae bacterium]